MTSGALSSLLRQKQSSNVSNLGYLKNITQLVNFSPHLTPIKWQESDTGSNNTNSPLNKSSIDLNDGLNYLNSSFSSNDSMNARIVLVEILELIHLISTPWF